MIGYYDQNGRHMSLLEWASAFNDREGRIVQQDTVGELFVSTVWLGLDHQFVPGGPPLIFETMIEGPAGWSDYQERYSTREQAIEGHQRALRLAASGALSPPTDAGADAGGERD